MLDKTQTIIVVVDVQGRLAELMDQSALRIARQCALIEGAQLLDIPILWVEQLADKLGATTPAVAKLLADQQPIGKSSFACSDEPAFMRALVDSGRRQVLLCGLEAHICVYQTALRLLERGYQVSAVGDAIAARDPEQRSLALQRMQQAGVLLSSVEMALFELQRRAEGAQFAALIRLVKSLYP